MTLYVGGETVTAAIMNSFDDILKAASWTTNRMTIVPNTTFNLASNHVSSNIVFNGSVACGANQYYRGIDFRTLTSVLTAGAGTPDAACISFDHQSTVGAGCGAYGIIGTVTLNGGSGTGRAGYFRTGYSNTFTGACSGLTAALSLHVAPTGTTNILDLALDCDGAYTCNLGISFGSNTPGVGTLTTAIAVTNTIVIGGVVLEWVQQSGNSSATQRFLDLVNPLGVETFYVDGLGNLNFAATGVTAGQKITGDFVNATHSLRTLVQSGGTNKNTNFGILPSGSATASTYRAYNTSNADAAGTIALSINTSLASLNSYNNGGSTVPFEIQMATVQVTAFKTNKDITLGQAGAAAADTAGHIYIQAVAGAPTGVPTGYAGFVPVRYDSSNNYLYVYNGGWKKSTVYA
jgi:hypothetical protein